MDPAVRDDLRNAPGVAKSVAPRRLAARRPIELCDAVGGQSRPERRRRVRKSRRHAAHLPAASAALLLLQPVSVLPELDACDQRVRYLGPHEPRAVIVPAARALHFRHHRHVVEPAAGAATNRSAPAPPVPVPATRLAPATFQVKESAAYPRIQPSGCRLPRSFPAFVRKPNSVPAPIATAHTSPKPRAGSPRRFPLVAPDSSRKRCPSAPRSASPASRSPLCAPALLRSDPAGFPAPR